jgi:uncharacterized protein (DUF2235 family)
MHTYQIQHAPKPSERKRCVLFFDGTRNDRRSDTNIQRLFGRLAPSCADGVTQEGQYWEGVGIKPWETVRGSAFGLRISEKIKEGYQWLAGRHSDGDEINIFGFSRGAYTAMGLVGLLAWRGLPKQSMSSGELERLFDLFRQATQKSREDKSPGCRSLEDLCALSSEDKQTLDDQDKEVLAKFRRAPINFLGLFDTVRAAGFEVFQWFGNQKLPEVPQGKYLTPGTLALRYTRHLPPNVARAYQALAVDEHRAVFHPRVWIVPKERQQSRQARMAEQIAEQRWFIGAHANVGGGYRCDRLAEIPLSWMQEKAAEAGIHFTATSRPTLTRASWRLPEFKVRDSYSAWLLYMYRLFRWERYYRPIYPWGLRHEDGAVVIEYESPTIDESVLRRILEDEKYRPRNVKDCLELLRSSKVQLDNPTDLLVAKCLAVTGWSKSE